jgi:hypothetical protein
MRARIVTFLSACVLLSACASSPPEPRGPGNPKLARYETADAVADCRRAIASHDFRFLAVYGFTWDVPGIEDFKTKYQHRYRHRFLDGTSEMVTGSEDVRLQGIAREYAARYNRYLFHYVRSHNEA